VGRNRLEALHQPRRSRCTKVLYKVHVKGFTVNPPGLPAKLHGAGARRRIRHQGLPTDSRGGCRQPLWNRRWVAGRLSFAMSAEAGREFDKLATALTTPRHSLTREVNLVVSLSRTPSLITSPFRSHLLPSYDRFALFVFRFANGAPRPSTSCCLPTVGRHLFQLRRRYRTIGCQPACRTRIAL